LTLKQKLLASKLENSCQWLSPRQKSDPLSTSSLTNSSLSTLRTAFTTIKQLKTWIDYFLCNFRSLKLIFMGLFGNKGLKNSLMVLQGGFGNLAASE